MFTLLTSALLGDLILLPALLAGPAGKYFEGGQGPTPSAEPLCRFDAMLLTPPTSPAADGYAVEWLRDAFRADDS